MATRAAPLSPDQRRASIIAATLPLLRVHGRSVTTAQIAHAAGVAEGTLFRAFPDKDALIMATIQNACDPAPTERKLAAIDRALPLRERLLAAVEILQRRVEQVWEVITSLNLPLTPRAHQINDQGLRDEMERLFEGKAGELRVDARYAMRVLRTLVFAGTHPRMTDNQPFTSDEIVTLMLEGIGKN